MKTTSGASYAHVSALRGTDRDDCEKAMNIAGLEPDQFNVVKFKHNDHVITLLSYDRFFEEGCPELRQSWTVHMATGRVVARKYNPENPPILHRKELLLDPEHEKHREFEQLTLKLEDADMFDDSNRIGFKRYWVGSLKEKGLRIVGNSLEKL